jgi:gas vesicle structural protein
MSEKHRGYLSRPQPSGLADVVEIILDKGLVIDAYVRVSLVGIEMLTIDARIVVSSVDTFLRFAEATNRLDLSDKSGRSLMDIGGDVMENVASNVVEGKVESALDRVGDAFGEPARNAARYAGGKILDFAEDMADADAAKRNDQP